MWSKLVLGAPGRRLRPTGSSTTENGLGRYLVNRVVDYDHGANSPGSFACSRQSAVEVGTWCTGSIIKALRLPILSVLLVDD